MKSLNINQGDSSLQFRLFPSSLQLQLDSDDKIVSLLADEQTEPQKNNLAYVDVLLGEHTLKIPIRAVYYPGNQ